jgi:hypothetical protein
MGAAPAVMLEMRLILLAKRISGRAEVRLFVPGAVSGFTSAVSADS